MGAAVLAESDLDRITDRFKALMLEARGAGGSLPCHDHEDRMRKIERLAWKAAGAILIVTIIGGFLGSLIGGAAFDRAARVALERPPVMTSPAPQP